MLGAFLSVLSAPAASSSIALFLPTAGLLLLSNLFMTWAWYGHLKTLGDKPLWIAILSSWGIALFEYSLMVPANRIGFGTLSLAQLKILQEVITLLVFVPFALLVMKQPLKLDFLWAGLCMCGAVYFIFR
eukprot:gene35774-44111_t